MKIALNVETIGTRQGGAEKYAGILVRWLAAAGHEVHVLARTVEARELPPQTTVHWVRPYIPPGCNWLRNYLFARASERILAGQQYDLIIGLVMTWYQHVYIAVGGSHPASLVGNSFRFHSAWRRGLFWILKAINPKQWVLKLIAHRMFAGRHAPRLIAPSRLVAEHFQQFHGVRPEQIDVVPNGIDASAELPDREAARAVFRRRWELTPEHVAILIVARNYPLKGVEPLLDAFAPVVRRQPHARLLVCGHRRDRKYRRQAARLGIDDRVQFLGYVDDVRECYAGADAFAFPTFYDPCSLVVLEAMRAGLPVITTRQNGASELVREGIDGYVIDSPWALDEMTARLEQLTVDGALRERMGRAGRTGSDRLLLARRSAEMLAVLTRAAVDPLASPQARRAA